MAASDDQGLRKIAVPRDSQSRNKPAWDAERLVVPPVSLQHAWNCRTAPPGFKTCTSLKVNMVRQKEPFALDGLVGSMTVAEVKAALARAMYISVRKLITLERSGNELDDKRTLDELFVSEGATLDVSFRARAQAELAAFRSIRHVIILDQSGIGTVLEGVSNSTTPAAR